VWYSFLYLFELIPVDSSEYKNLEVVYFQLRCSDVSAGEQRGRLSSSTGVCVGIWWRRAARQAGISPAPLTDAFGDLVNGSAADLRLERSVGLSERGAHGWLGEGGGALVRPCRGQVLAARPVAGGIYAPLTLNGMGTA
jgi:hypothetical protein